MVRRKVLHLAVILSMMLTMVGVVLPAAVGAASLTINPPSVNFDSYKTPVGGQQNGTQSQPVVITITNTDPGPITINNVTVTTGGADFAVSGNGCLNDVLSNGQQCQFSVVFKPQAGTLGAKNGQVTITTSQGPSFVSLSGTSTSPTLTFSPLVLNFGPQQAGTASSTAQTITFTNTGDGGVQFNFFTLSDPTDYNVVGDTCSSQPASTLGPGQSCTVSVVFTPQSTGSFDGATISFLTSAAGTPFNVQVLLNGTGVAPQGTISPSQLNFGAVLLNTFSGPQTVTLQNTGTGPLTLDGNFASNNTAFIIQSNQCVPGVVLAAGAGPGTYCTFQVVFNPTT